MENKNAFLDHLNKSSQIVREWPSWKQNAAPQQSSASDNSIDRIKSASTTASNQSMPRRQD